MALINFAGLASGIDSNALIDAMSKATRAQKVDPLTTKVDELTETDTILDELKSKFSDLKDLIYTFTTISGGGISKTATSSNEAFAGATASNSAANGAYSLNITNLARNGTFWYAHSFTGGTDTVSVADGDVTVTVGTGVNLKTLTVPITGGSTTVNQFIASFNEEAAKNENCATASLVNVGTSTTPDFRVMISSSNTGTEKGELAITAGVGNLVAAGGTMNNAEDAEFDLNGITGIVRQSNSVSDIIPGVTFNLTGIGSSDIAIADDAAATETRIQDWVDKYNEIITFVDENNQILRDESGSEVTNIFKPLAGTSTDDLAVRAVRDALASTKSAVTGTAVNIFADLGITTQRDGTLKFDKDKFEEALGASSASANSILTQFADTLAKTGGTIDAFIRFNGSFDITLNSNKTLIDSLNRQISDAERSISEQEDSLRARFARLEATIGQMQQQQSALTSALSGLSK